MSINEKSYSPSCASDFLMTTFTSPQRISELPQELVILSLGPFSMMIIRSRGPAPSQLVQTNHPRPIAQPTTARPLSHPGTCRTGFDSIMCHIYGPVGGGWLMPVLPGSHGSSESRTSSGGEMLTCVSR